MFGIIKVKVLCHHNFEENFKRKELLRELCLQGKSRKNPEEKSIFKPIEKIKLDSIGILNTKLTLDEISIVINWNVG